MKNIGPVTMTVRYDKRHRFLFLASLIIIVIQSEDDLNTTASDLDSQPRTPLQSSVLTEDEGTPKFTKDGLFKIPRDRHDSFSSQTEQDHLIAQRTRSKVSLEGTPIETLESSFIPPDLQADADCEDMLIDYNYLEFLSNLFYPVENGE